MEAILKAHHGKVEVPDNTPKDVIFLPSASRDKLMSRILIGEDDEAIAQGLRDNFQFEGHETQWASDGETAVRLARDEKPDLILLDVRLLRMSGRSLPQAAGAGATIPILMLTARGEEEDRILGLDLGADDYHVATLRAKLEDDPSHPRKLHTARGGIQVVSRALKVGSTPKRTVCLNATPWGNFQPLTDIIGCWISRTCHRKLAPG